MVFDTAPVPYKTIYNENRLLGHVCAQYFSATAALTTAAVTKGGTKHRDGEECFLGMCVSIGGLPRTFHVLEGGTNDMECDQKNGDVYFTSFSLSSHAISRPIGTGDERDTVVIFRPLVSATEAELMEKDLKKLKRPGLKATTRMSVQSRDGMVVDFYDRLAKFIVDGPIAP